MSCNSTGMMGCSTKLDLLEIRMLSQYAKFSMLMPRSRAFSGSAFSNQTKADTQQAKSTELEFKRQASLLIDAMGAVKKMGRIYCNGLWVQVPIQTWRRLLWILKTAMSQFKFHFQTKISHWLSTLTGEILICLCSFQLYSIMTSRGSLKKFMFLCVVQCHRRTQTRINIKYSIILTVYKGMDFPALMLPLSGIFLTW